MGIENLKNKMLTACNDATTQEIECMKTYPDEGDLYGDFDTYYKVWSTEKIEKLELQKKKLTEVLQNYVTGENYKMRSLGKLITPEMAEAVLEEIDLKL